MKIKGYFLKEGKYGSDEGASVEVTAEDVEKKNTFEIDKHYALYFIEAGVFVAGGSEPEKETFKEEKKKTSTKKKESDGDESEK